MREIDRSKRKKNIYPQLWLEIATFLSRKKKRESAKDRVASFNQVSEDSV